MRRRVGEEVVVTIAIVAVRVECNRFFAGRVALMLLTVTCSLVAN